MAVGLTSSDACAPGRFGTGVWVSWGRMLQVVSVSYRFVPGPVVPRGTGAPIHRGGPGADLAAREPEPGAFPGLRRVVSRGGCSRLVRLAAYDPFHGPREAHFPSRPDPGRAGPSGGAVATEVLRFASNPLGRVFDAAGSRVSTLPHSVACSCEQGPAAARCHPRTMRFDEGRVHDVRRRRTDHVARREAWPTLSVASSVEEPAPLCALVQETRSGATRIGFRHLLWRRRRVARDDRCRRLRGILNNPPGVITVLAET